MRLAIGLTALALLAASVAQGQRLEPSRFSDRKDATRLITPVAFIPQDTTRCDHSVPRFLGQFLAGTLGGAASAVLLFGISGFGDYQIHGDSFSSVTFLRLQIAAQAVGAAAGAWTAAPRNCRAFVPALIGSAVAGIVWADSGESAGAFALIGPFIFGIPVQAMSATVAQTLAR